MKKVILVLAMIIVSFSALYADTHKVVYDLSSGDSTKIKKHLLKSVDALMQHYKKENKELKVIVVISGKSYKYFVDDLSASPYATDKDVLAVQSEMQAILEKMAKEDSVYFAMCKAGMKARNINPKTLYPFVHSEQTKSVYLIEAQNSGYAYMPIH